MRLVSQNSHGSVKEHQDSAYQEEPTTGAEGHPDLCRKVSLAITALPFSMVACCDAWRGKAKGHILWASDNHMDGILFELERLTGIGVDFFWQ